MTLSEQISQRVLDEYRGKMSQRQLAHRMAKHMTGRTPDSVLKQLRRNITGAALWRADYIEAAVEVLGISRIRMMNFAKPPKRQRVFRLLTPAEREGT